MCQCTAAGRIPPEKMVAGSSSRCLLLALLVTLAAMTASGLGGGGTRELAERMAAACLPDPECRARRIVYDDASARSLTSEFEATLRSHGLSDAACGGLAHDISAADARALAADLRPSCADPREAAECKASAYMAAALTAVIAIAVVGFVFLFVVTRAQIAQLFGK